MTVEEPMIQIWVTSEECDNFSQHMTDYAKMIGVDLEGLQGEAKRKKAREHRFPSHLPYSVLKDLKEGQTLTLTHKSGVTFKLVASQTTTRYKNFGTFEKVLKDLEWYVNVD